jgi:hypothetical protein
LYGGYKKLAEEFRGKTYDKLIGIQNRSRDLIRDDEGLLRSTDFPAWLAGANGLEGDAVDVFSASAYKPIKILVSS